MTSDNRALVLFSGGQDSAACLAYALDRHERAELPNALLAGAILGFHHILIRERWRFAA